MVSLLATTGAARAAPPRGSWLGWGSGWGRGDATAVCSRDCGSVSTAHARHPLGGGCARGTQLSHSVRAVRKARGLRAGICRSLPVVSFTSAMRERARASHTHTIDAHVAGRTGEPHRPAPAQAAPQAGHQPVPATTVAQGPAAAGLWAELQRLGTDRPELAAAAEAARGLALGSNAQRTRERYTGVFRAFTAFCAGHRIPRTAFFPASAAVVALYVQHVSARGLAASSVRVALAAIKWAHVVSGYADPCTDATLRLVVAGAQREAARPVRHANPLRPVDLDRCLRHLQARYTFRSVRLALMMRIAFAAFLRISELMALRWCDITVRDGALCVFIARRKNDQEAQGATRLIPLEPESVVGAQQLLRDYAAALGQPVPSTSTLGMWPNWATGGAPDYLSPMSRADAYAGLRAALTAVGVDGDTYTWHSLRAGAATSAADRGVPEPLMMAAGGWKSADAARGYVHYSAATMLATVATATAVDRPSEPGAARHSATTRDTSGEHVGPVPRASRTARRATPASVATGQTRPSPRQRATSYEAREVGDGVIQVDRPGEGRRGPGAR